MRELNEGMKRIYDEMEGLYLNPPVFSEPNNMWNRDQVSVPVIAP